jgi:hypothetical protein
MSGSGPTVPRCARAFAGVRHKQARQGGYPAAFVYGSPTRATGRTWVAVVIVGVSRSKRVILRESGPERWARWKGWLEDGTCGSRAEVARREGVSRAAVTQGLGKLEEPSKPSG